MRSLCFAFALIFALGTTVQADDFNPPPWRGGPLTVQAEWEFTLPDLYDVVPEYLVTVGDGIHSLGTAWTHGHPTDLFWEPDPNEPGDGRAYSGAIPGTLDLFLVNWEDLYDYKYIWVQITYGGQGVPVVYEVVAPPWENPVFGMPVWSWEGVGRRIEEWVIAINPNREYVNIEFPPFTWVDQIVVDTISTQGPTSVEDSSWGQIKALYR